MALESSTSMPEARWALRKSTYIRASKFERDTWQFTLGDFEETNTRESCRPIHPSLATKTIAIGIATWLFFNN